MLLEGPTAEDGTAATEKPTETPEIKPPAPASSTSDTPNPKWSDARIYRYELAHRDAAFREAWQKSTPTERKAWCEKWRKAFVPQGAGAEE
jgi:hypothetical protein